MRQGSRESQLRQERPHRPFAEIRVSRSRPHRRSFLAYIASLEQAYRFLLPCYAALNTQTPGLASASHRVKQ